MLHTRSVVTAGLSYTTLTPLLFVRADKRKRAWQILSFFVDFCFLLCHNLLACDFSITCVTVTNGSCMCIQYRSCEHAHFIGVFTVGRALKDASEHRGDVSGRKGSWGLGGHTCLGKQVNRHFDWHTVEILEREHCICHNIVVNNDVYTKHAQQQILFGSSGAFYIKICNTSPLRPNPNLMIHRECAWYIGLIC